MTQSTTHANGWRFSGYAGFNHRGGVSTARKRTAVYCIEGEFLTTLAIGQRLGASETHARRRLKDAANAGLPVTWTRLRA